MAAVGRPGPITVLPEDFQKRESPNTRRPITELVFEGQYRARFAVLNIALGSACEMKYLSSLTLELGYARGTEWTSVVRQSDDVVKQLQRLVQQMEQSVSEATAKSTTRTEGWRLRTDLVRHRVQQRVDPERVARHRHLVEVLRVVGLALE